MKFVYDAKLGRMMPETGVSEDLSELEQQVFKWLDNNVAVVVDESYSTRRIAFQFFLQHPEYDDKANMDEARTACAKWFNANQDKIAEFVQKRAVESKEDRQISPMITIKMAKVGADGITGAAESASPFKQESILCRKSDPMVKEPATEASKDRKNKYWLTYGDWEGSRTLIKFDKPVTEKEAIRLAKDRVTLQENIKGYETITDAEEAADVMAKRHAESYNDGVREDTKVVNIVAKDEDLPDPEEVLKKIPEKFKKGNCYKEAWDLFFMNAGRGAKLVHGIVTGRGPIEGIKYNHAWIEVDNVVYDATMEITKDGMPKDVYYRLADIDENFVYKYTKDDVAKKAEEFMTYGPWENVLWLFP